MRQARQHGSYGSAIGREHVGARNGRKRRVWYHRQLVLSLACTQARTIPALQYRVACLTAKRRPFSAQEAAKVSAKTTHKLRCNACTQRCGRIYVTNIRTRKTSFYPGNTSTSQKQQKRRKQACLSPHRKVLALPVEESNRRLELLGVQQHVHVGVGAVAIGVETATRVPPANALLVRKRASNKGGGKSTIRLGL